MNTGITPQSYPKRVSLDAGCGLEYKPLGISHVKEIIKLSKLTTEKLRKLNCEQDRLYIGEELTREQLIFQLVFLMGAPED
jgi:hypothetical protein